MKKFLFSDNSISTLYTLNCVPYTTIYINLYALIFLKVTTHERIHTGIIKFECKICDYKCNRYLSMETHRQEEHGYLCSICQAKLSEWSDIKNHTLNEHGGYLSSEFSSGRLQSLCPQLCVTLLVFKFIFVLIIKWLTFISSIQRTIGWYSPRVINIYYQISYP